MKRSLISFIKSFPYTGTSETLEAVLERLPFNTTITVVDTRLNKNGKYRASYWKESEYGDTPLEAALALEKKFSSK